MPVGRTGTPPLQPCLLTFSYIHYVMFGCLWEINSIQFNSIQLPYLRMQLDRFQVLVQKQDLN